MTRYLTIVVILLATVASAQIKPTPTTPTPTTAPATVAAPAATPAAVAAQPFRLDLKLPAAASGVELYVLDGDTGRELALPTAAAADLALAVNRTDNGKWAVVSVTITSRRSQQAKLELGLRLRTGAVMKTFFDGERPVEIKTEQKSDRFTGRFPLTTIADETTCLALGYAPDQWLSYLRHSCLPAARLVTLETATRIVVDPGKAEKVDFLVGAFAGGWGHLEALHWYYEAYPAFFGPRADVDGRASLNGGSYLVWTASPDAEMCRRMRVGWEWCYAPFKRTGDIFGRAELWDYKPARAHDKSRLVTLEEYHAARHNQFENGKLCDVAMMCYLPSQVWCEEQLARAKYADALTTDPGAKTYFDTPWVTGPDNELRVFPFMTSFGQQSLVDMADLVKENNIQGFAFDTANGGAKYTGPHVNECPGRAWDQRGVYVDEGVAIAKLMDWCHQAKDSSGQTLAVVSNPGAAPCYLTPLRSDSAMIEADPTAVRNGSALTLRNFLGHKTMVMWENYDLEELLSYKTMKPEQMAEALRGLADYTIIASLRVAAIPTPRVCLGNRKLVQWLPLLTEVAAAGWQPVAAATCSAGLPLTRTGSGLKQFIAGGNETDKAIDTTVVIENGWLGPGATLFMPENAELALNEVAGGLTKANMSLAARGAQVLRSVANLTPAPTALRVNLARPADLHLATLTLRLETTGEQASTLTLPDWGTLVPERITLDQADVQFQPVENGWRSTTPLRLTGKQELKVTLRSSVFKASRRQLASFPWVRGAAAGFGIQVDPNAGPELTAAARQLAQYFTYYHAHAVEPAATVAPAAVNGPGAEGLGKVIIRVVPTADRPMSVGTAGGGTTLNVVGRTAADARQALYRLMAALDASYPYGGGLTGTEAIRTVGLAGKEIK